MKCPRCSHESLLGSNFCGRCGMPFPLPKGMDELTRSFQPPPLRKLIAGSYFAGRFLIFEEVGRGPAGKVYKAFDAVHKEFMAVRLLSPDISADDQAVDRLQAEIGRASGVRHPCVGRLYGLGREERSVYVTAEYISGENLRSLLRRGGPLSVKRALHIAGQVAEGLAAAHRMRVFHFDLKPGNIILERDGAARITDFGLAPIMRITGNGGGGQGAPAQGYRAPEQAGALEPDGRSDLYALGAILCEVVTGHLPFAGEEQTIEAENPLAARALEPWTFDPSLYESVSRIILKCLEPEREKRFQTAEDFLSALAALDGSPAWFPGISKPGA